MTKHERMVAFEMRLDGKSWREIGDALGYAHTTIYNDLSACLVTHPRTPICPYPALRRVIEEQYGGSIHSFAAACGLTYNAMYYTLTGRSKLAPARQRIICSVTGLSPDEAFQREDA